MNQTNLHAGTGTDGTEVDVVIVGCGPTGATLSLLLAKYGLTTLILERERSIYPLPRAVHFDDQIMRVFQSIGVVEKLEKVVRYNPGMRFVDPTGQLLLDWPRPAGVGENGWHTSYRFHQPDLESILREKIESNVHARLMVNVEVSSLEQSDQQVTVGFTDRQSGESDSVQARYVVGCDGARSIVRKHINEDVEDLGFKERWLVIDVLLQQEKPELGDFTIQHCGRERPATYVRCPANRRRWEISLKPDDDLNTVTSDESVWDLIGQWLSPHEAIIERRAVYEFRSLIAKQWRDRRILIAGDAAHLTPPFMGQGMCAGIRDVANLSWKLASCCGTHGCSDSTKNELLDSYQSERIPNVREYIETAIRLGTLINSCSTEQSLKQAFGKKEGTEKMKSIVPRLGVGLGAGDESQRGGWFPQPLLSNGQLLDQTIGLNPVLLISATLFADYQRSAPNDEICIAVISVEQEPALASVLAEYGAEAVLLRPDRYLLGAANDVSQLQSLINAALLFVPSTDLDY